MTGTHRRAYPIPVLLAAAALAIPATAWKSDLSEQVMPIAEARDGADLGDFFAIEAVVARVAMDQVFLLQDESGEMYVRIPSRLLREQGAPESGERIRVAGRYARETLDRQLHGMAVQRLERRVEAPQRPAAPTPAAPDGEAGDPPPASLGDPQVYPPQVSREWVERLGAARQELLEAHRQLQEAAVAYGRELRRAGEPSAMDPTVVAHHDRAEARLAEARRAIPPLVEQARREGIPADILDLYQRSNQPR